MARLLRLIVDDDCDPLTGASLTPPWLLRGGVSYRSPSLQIMPDDAQEVGNFVTNAREPGEHAGQSRSSRADKRRARREAAARRGGANKPG